jgi:hypothetical protein
MSTWALRARDLDQLALTDGKRADRTIEIPVGQPERRQRLSCAQAQTGPPMQKRHFGTSEPDVVENRQMRGEAQLLRYQSETQALCLLRSPYGLCAAVDGDRAAVRLHDPHQNLDECALPRAVLAAQTADFPSAERK